MWKVSQERWLVRELLNKEVHDGKYAGYSDGVIDLTGDHATSNKNDEHGFI